MSSRHFPVLAEAQFRDLFDVYQQAGIAAAGSALLTAFQGDQRAAECALWGTWNALVGGEPGRRPEKAADEDGPVFLMKLVAVITAGTETPRVARIEARLQVAA